MMHQPHAAHGAHDWAERVAHLEFEAELLAPILDEAVSLLRAHGAGEPVRRILDVGCGPGVASVSLAHAFPDAQVVASDRAPAMLAMVRARADRNGLGDRISTQVADLAVGLGVGGPFDLAWASMVLHHLADPERVLRELHGVLRPGGLVGLVEFGPPPRSLPEDLGFGEPGFEGRLVDAMGGTSEGHVPVGAQRRDWTATMSQVGFEPRAQRTLMLTLHAPLAERTRRWIFQKFAFAEHQVRDRLSATDCATLAILVDAADSRSVMRRQDLVLDEGRTLYIARKAA